MNRLTSTESPGRSVGDIETEESSDTWKASAKTETSKAPAITMTASPAQVIRRTTLPLSVCFRVASMSLEKGPRDPQASRAPRRHVC